ncbi:MAG: hypothetical protein ACJAW3_000086 [Lentimonas sp.]|jgi:hypothetical protein
MVTGNKLNFTKKIGFTTAAIIIIANIILWISLFWLNEDFLSSRTYIKIVITSVALSLLSLVISGLASYLEEENLLRKDKFIN